MAAQHVGRPVKLAVTRQQMFSLTGYRTPTIQGLVTPDIDESLDEQPAKTAFWNAFKVLGEWWSETPPY